MSFRDTATEAMRTARLTQYVGQAEPVLAALDAQETQIVESLIAAGTAMGANQDQVRDALRQAGLTVAIAHQGGGVDPARVTRLEQFARRHGFTG